MKGRFLFVLFFLGMAISAFAQEESDPVRVHLRRTVPWQKSYSVEIGTGIPPIHMIMVPTYEVERALAEKGQEANLEGAIHPVVSLSGVYRVREASELLLTVGVSCCYYDITQYAVFGTDPDGNPRYDLEKGAYAGRIRSDSPPWRSWPSSSLTSEAGMIPMTISSSGMASSRSQRPV